MGEYGGRYTVTNNFDIQVSKRRKTPGSVYFRNLTLLCERTKMHCDAVDLNYCDAIKPEPDSYSVRKK